MLACTDAQDSARGDWAGLQGMAMPPPWPPPDDPILVYLLAKAEGCLAALALLKVSATRGPIWMDVLDNAHRAVEHHRGKVSSEVV
jgi:hypothetical protein